MTISELITHLKLKALSNAYVLEVAQNVYDDCAHQLEGLVNLEGDTLVMALRNIAAEYEDTAEGCDNQFERRAYIHCARAVMDLV